MLELASLTILEVVFEWVYWWFWGMKAEASIRELDEAARPTRRSVRLKVRQKGKSGLPLACKEKYY